MSEIFLDKAIAVRERRPELSRGVAALLDRMLIKDPRKRPGDAGALSDEVSELISALVTEGMVTGETSAVFARTLVEEQVAASEQRVVSAIVVSPPGSATRDRTGTWDIPTAAVQRTKIELFDESTLARVEEVIAPFGGRAELFLGTALAVTVRGEGTPSDVATEAGRCALALRHIAPRVCFAVGTGRSSGGRGTAAHPTRLEPGDQDALGDLIAETATMLSGCDPGSIRLDVITAGLLEGRFQIGPDTADPSRQRLLFEKGLKEAPRTVLGKEIPCVGREREITNLLSYWAESSGEPVARAIIVTAPPGGGKSRVRHELMERIQSRGEPFQFLVGRGDSVRAGTPYAVLGPALRSVLGLQGGEPPAVQQKRLVTHVERVIPGPPARKVAAFLGEIADIKFPDDDLPQLKAAREDPRLMADQVLAGWLDYIEAECKLHPVLIVFEDLHWGDFPSVQLVDAALRNLTERPLMVLAFARPEIDVKFPKLWDAREVQRVVLGPLSARHAQNLVKQILGDLPPDKAAWIVERATGNPFYIEELARAVGTGQETQGMPTSVLGMVQGRLDALGPDAKRVLRAASVFGATFKASGVRSLVGDADHSLDQWLEILTKKEIVFSRPAGETMEFAFRHALLEETSYAMLTHDDKVVCHRRAGEYLEEHKQQDANVLAGHFEKGGLFERAAHWCAVAAQHALDANDLDAVLERVERGIRLGATDDEVGSMLVARAQARFWRGEYREGVEAASRASQLLKGARWYAAVRELIAAEGQLQKYDEVEAWAARLREQPPEESQRGAWLESLVCALCYLIPAGRDRAADDLLSFINKHDRFHGRSSRARLVKARGLRLWAAGKLVGAIQQFEAAAAEYQAMGDVRSQIEMMANVGALLVDLGVIDLGEAKLTAVLAASERMGLSFLVVYAQAVLCLLRSYLGRFDESRALGEAGVRLGRAQGDLRAEGMSLCHLSQAAALAGQAREAEAHAREAARVLAGVPPLLAVARASLSQSLLHQGQPGEALTEASQAYQTLAHAGRVDDDSFVRLAYAEALEAVGRAEELKAVVKEAAERIAEKASIIENEEWKEAFLSRLPSNARLLALAARLSSNEGRRII
jgi:tetratricopeptide (TPR) repeat protein